MNGRLKMMWILAIGVVLAIASGYAFPALEDLLVFQPYKGEHPWQPHEQLASDKLEGLIADVSFSTADGSQLNGWLIPAEIGRPTVLMAHGQSGNMGRNRAMIETFADAGYGVLTFDYRGYGTSEGVSSEAGFVQDVEAASDYLLNRHGIGMDEQIALGYSLGGAAVIDVASRRKFRTVVICSSFTSIPDLVRGARSSFMPLPVENLMHNRFDSVSKVGAIESPVLFVHGLEDHKIPSAMSEQLYRRSTSRHKDLILVDKAGHRNVFEVASQDIVDHLDQLLADSAVARDQGSRIASDQ